LQQVKDSGLKLFLTTNESVFWMHMTMEATLGEDWSKLFDLKITKCDKPLFYKNEAPFFECLKEGKKRQKNLKMHCN
jgi:hypothetical protein